MTWSTRRPGTNFDLAAAARSLDGVTWRIVPADKAALEPLGARSGYRVECTVCADMPEGDFNGSLDLTAKPSVAGEKPRTLALPVQGRVQGRVTLSGRQVHDGTLDLGMLNAGASLTTFFLLKVNDDCKSLTVNEIETNPKFLHVRLAPTGGAPQYGLYRFEVEMANAPQCNFLGTAGFIRLKTDHPRLPVVNLRVEMAVASAR